MYQIAINDPKIYLDGEAYAKENHSTLEELVNKYVASLADRVRSRNKPTGVVFSQTEEFQKTLELVKSMAAKGGSPVPVDEKGIEVLVEAKHEV